MNSNPAAAICFFGLIALAIYAVIGAQGNKWKLLNLLIIIGFMAAGLAIGYWFGIWGGNLELGGHVSASLMVVLGLVGAFGCVLRNKRREVTIP